MINLKKTFNAIISRRSASEDNNLDAAAVEAALNIKKVDVDGTNITYEIGIVLHGQPRYYNIVKKYWDEAFPDCKIDYFIHAWNIDSVDGRNQFPDDRWQPYNKKDGPEASDPWIVRYDANKLKKELQDIYNTSNVIVSDYDRHVHGLRRVPNLDNGKVYVHQWRSFEKASKLLKRSEKEYDLIVCSRLDMVLEPKPDLVRRLTHVIEENESPDDELIICCTFPENTPSSFDGMFDWLWFGTKQGMIRFGHNFTRNQITDPKFLDRGYRVRWGDQLKRNNVPVYIIPDHKWELNWGLATLIKPECPSFDIKTIKNYSKYHEDNTRGKIELGELKPYDPKIKYWNSDWNPVNEKYDSKGERLNDDYDPIIHDFKIKKEPLFYDVERRSNESFERSVARSPYGVNSDLINQETLGSLNEYLQEFDDEDEKYTAVQHMMANTDISDKLLQDKTQKSVNKKSENKNWDPNGEVFQYLKY